MGFPQSIDSTTPLPSDSPAFGDDHLRSTKDFIVNVLGITNAASYSAAAFSIATTGVVTVSQLGFNAKSLILSQGSITAQALGLDASVTWNQGATVFTAWKLNVTDTASAAASLFVDFQVAAVSKFNIDKSGKITTLASIVTPFITLTQGTITALQPIIDASVTWNAALTFTGFKLNLTDTSSNAASLLMDLQVSAASKFSVRKDGLLTTPAISVATPIASTDAINVAMGTITLLASNFNASATWNSGAVTFTAIKLNITDNASNAASLLFDLQVASASVFKVDKFGILTTGRQIIVAGVYSGLAYVIDASVTWNQGGTTFTGIRLIVTDTASAAASLLMDLQTGAGSKWKVDKAGLVTQASDLAIGTNPAASGIVRVSNNRSISARNAANGADISMIFLDASDRINLGASGTEVMFLRALVALGGGAAPTFGTIGGSGPATAAQNTWMQWKDSGGANFWVPAWK